jgi:multidrug efflux pump subunit AcrB
VSGIVSWFARNSIAANLLMFLILLGGVVTFPSITQKTFPDVDPDMITVGVEYLGAAPEEVERGVCSRVEEALEGVEGVDEVDSVASEGLCSVRAELLQGADTAKALDDVKSRIDAIDTFPEETEKPVVKLLEPRPSVIDLAISGQTDERSLKVLGERVRDEILALPGITQVDLASVRPYEVSIELSEAALRRHGLTFDQVTEAVRRTSLDIPGGSLRTEGGEILLRTRGQAYYGPEFEKLVVLTREDGTRLSLGEISRVSDGFQETDQASWFDAAPTILVRVFRVGDQDGIEIADRVTEYVARTAPRLPAGIQIHVWRDNMVSLRQRVGILVRNGMLGFALVLGVLALFLRPRLAVWVSLGVPISLLGALWTMPALGMTINVMSTFAFILVIGILVDDAVVVGENVYTHHQYTDDPIQAAIQGTNEVTVPVVFGVLTTVCAFAPLGMMGGRPSQIFAVLAIIVISALAFSLVESLLILPAHLASVPIERTRGRRGWIGRWEAFQDRISAGFENFAQVRYRRWLESALDWRHATAAAGLCVLLWTIGLVASGRMRFAYFPYIEDSYVSARLTMPAGTPIDITTQAARQLERSAALLAEQLAEELGAAGEDIIRHTLTSVGDQPLAAAQQSTPGGTGAEGFAASHLAEVTLELSPSEQRVLRTREIARRWRDTAGPVPDAVELVFSSSFINFGSPISVQLRGHDLNELRAAAERLKAILAEYPGVFDIHDSFRAGKRELQLSIRPEAEALGLTLSDLGRQVRQAFYGAEAQRIQRGREDVRVMVRYPAHERRSLGDLDNLRIRTPGALEVPFASVADAAPGRGYASIQRSNRQRVVEVLADVEETGATANEVIAALEAGPLPQVLADYPGMSYGLEGQRRDQLESMEGLLRGFALALFAIYALLAIPLRSHTQALLIMAVIPFGLVGAIVGHLIMGQNLSILSIMGVIAASGVVVNSSLVLIHRTNSLRAAGLDPYAAVRDAALARIRPIVLTSLTTFAGLTPLLLNRSLTAQFLIPMATSLAFGVLFTTGITLFLVPAGYLILHDLLDREPQPEPTIG